MTNYWERTVMVFLIIFMLTLSVISCGWAVYQTDKARKHQEMNMAISEGLDDLLHAAKMEVTKNKKLCPRLFCSVWYYYNS